MSLSSIDLLIMFGRTKCQKGEDGPASGDDDALEREARGGQTPNGWATDPSC
jgi:hypothetical protein